LRATERALLGVVGAEEFDNAFAANQVSAGCEFVRETRRLIGVVSFAKRTKAYEAVFVGGWIFCRRELRCSYCGG
jgi:hypothetical protein